MTSVFVARLNVALQAVAQVLMVCLLGAWLARRHSFDRKAITAVSSVNWHVLIPSLLFGSIVGAVTPSNLVLLWPMLVISLLHIVIAALPALLLCWAARLPKDMTFFTVSCASLPNCGNLPWLFMPSIIRYYAPPDQAAQQVQYMVGLVSVYTIITIIVTLTVPFMFKRPPDTLLLPRRRTQQQQPHGPAAAQQPEDRLQQAGEGREEVLELVEPSSAAAAAAAGGVQAGIVLQQLLHLDTDANGADTGLPGNSRGSKDQAVQPTPAAAAAAAPLAVVGLTAAAAAASSPAAAAPVGLTPSNSCSTFELPTEVLDDSDNDGDDDGLQALDLQAAQQQQHRRQLPPAAAPGLLHHPAAAACSFGSHRSNSLLLQHSRELFGSFSKEVGSFGRSFRSSFSRGLRRSNSLVQLVWSVPRGWHRQQQRRGGTEGSSWQPSRLPPWLRRVVSLWQAFLAHPVVNLPLGATLAAIVCAAIGPVRQLLVEDMAPLHWLWLSLTWVGAAAAPLATLQIGAELVQPPPEVGRMAVSKRVQWTANSIAILVKLVLVPLVNVALLLPGGLSRLVPADDTVYQLLLLVEGAVPAAVTLLVVCGRMYPDIRPLSSMLFWQYVASLVTLPAFLIWFMSLMKL